jgi:hypothetical protein
MLIKISAKARLRIMYFIALLMVGGELIVCLTYKFPIALLIYHIFRILLFIMCVITLFLCKPTQIMKLIGDKNGHVQ